MCFCDFFVIIVLITSRAKRNDSDISWNKENGLLGLFMSNLNRSVKACVCEWLAAAAPVRSSMAVPHSILRGAIGTFHTEKSASSSTGLTLHGNFLAWLTRQPAHLPQVITANYPVRRSNDLSSSCPAGVSTSRHAKWTFGKWRFAFNHVSPDPGVAPLVPPRFGGAPSRTSTEKVGVHY